MSRTPIILSAFVKFLVIKFTFPSILNHYYKIHVLWFLEIHKDCDCVEVRVNTASKQNKKIRSKKNVLGRNGVAVPRVGGGWKRCHDVGMWRWRWRWWWTVVVVVMVAAMGRWCHWWWSWQVEVSLPYWYHIRSHLFW